MKNPVSVIKDCEHDGDFENTITFNIDEFPSRSNTFYFKATALNGINSLKVKLYVDNKLVSEEEHENSWLDEIRVKHSFI